MSRRDSLKKRNDGRGPPPLCGFGCRSFRPFSCQVLDPFTVKMVAVCIRCGKAQTGIGDLRTLVDETRTAEDFATEFMNAALPLGPLA